MGGGGGWDCAWTQVLPLSDSTQTVHRGVVVLFHLQEVQYSELSRLHALGQSVELVRQTAELNRLLVALCV